MRIFFVTSATTLLTTFIIGCATIGMLPQSANEVNFSAAEGKTGWSAYNQIEVFKNTTADEIYDAIKVGLGDAGFSVRRADLSNGVVIGEHGMTMHDWNIIAGAYFVRVGNDIKVKVIIEGSKDIGFSGDVTSDGWAGKILRGTRQHLNRTKQAILKVNREDISFSSDKSKPLNQSTSIESSKKRLLELYLNKEITKEEYFDLRRDLEKSK
jgi:hypothetical protein